MVRKADTKQKAPAKAKAKAEAGVKKAETKQAPPADPPSTSDDFVVFQSGESRAAGRVGEPSYQVGRPDGNGWYTDIQGRPSTEGKAKELLASLK